MRKLREFGVERVPPGGYPSPDPGSQADIEARERRGREKPILFSLPMARAVWDGVKTVTRRPLRPQPPGRDALVKRTGIDIHIASATWMGRADEFHICGPVGVACELAGLRNGYHWRRPYGRAGDRLWLRHQFWHYTAPSTNPNNEQAWDAITRCVRWTGGQRVLDCTPAVADDRRWEKRPSIHMSRWASVIHSEVVSVRAERLQEITEEDARAEGIREVTKDGVVKKYCVYDLGDMSSVPWSEMPRTAREAFRVSWEGTYAKRGLGWDANPFVWRIEFKEIADAR